MDNDHADILLHQEHAEKTGVDRDGRARPTRWSWIIPALASALVALIFFASLPPRSEVTRTPPTGLTVETLPEVSSEILSDLGKVLRSQVVTFGRIALYALIPGILGSIYRKKFWPWFLSAFAVLFVFNIVGFVGYGRSISSASLSGLHRSYWTYFSVEGGLFVLLLVFRLRRHVTFGRAPGRQVKNIVVCLDGTWNHPGQTDWGYLAQTNVFKLFDALDETEGQRGGPFNAARGKRYFVEGHERQVAFYYNGVGNQVDNSVIGRTVGGAFGLGANAIMERAYLDVAREYQHGDRIFIFGFSRGAALARMVASALDKRGVPEVVWTLRLFGRQRPVKTSKKHHTVKIAVLGCWDTVGAFGISKNFLGIPFQRINLLKDLSVPLSVERAYHLLALDEDRDSFEPTLMDHDPVTPGRITEIWFSGNHSNVGGGFATDGLSDHTLAFMLAHVSSGWDPETRKTTGDKSWGLYLKAGRAFKPNPLGQLRVSGGAIYTRRPREMALGAVFHDSVFDRIRDADSTYVPDGLFHCNTGISELRDKLTKEVTTLRKTNSLDEEGARKVEGWVKERLTIRKWSSVREKPEPSAELRNS